MPLQLPNLDDRTYQDLVEEALGMIPTLAPGWTNYNPSDPGITLIELFAYLSEMLLYRQNRVTDKNVYSFLKLLNGPDWQPSGTDSEALTRDIQETILALRGRERAISCEDFESLALAADSRVARVRCVPRRNLRRGFEVERAGHIGIIVVPQQDKESELPDMISAVENDLESKRRLLTTRLHIVGPQYLQIKVQTTVVPYPDVKEEEIEPSVKRALEKFLHPLEGGSDEKGWPFGRNVFVSEIYELVDQFPGVDYVTSVDLQRTKTNVPSRRIETKDPENNSVLVGIEVKPHELVKVEATVKTTQRSRMAIA